MNREKLLNNIVNNKIRAIKPRLSNTITQFSDEAVKILSDVDGETRQKRAITKLCTEYAVKIPKTTIRAISEAGSQYRNIVEFEQRNLAELGYLLPPLNLNINTLPVLEQMSNQQFDYIGGEKRLVNTTIKRELISQILTGRPISEVMDNIKTEFARLQLRAMHHAETLARTSAHLVSAGVVERMAEAVEIEWFAYAGPDDDITRVFCENIMSGMDENGVPNTTGENLWHISEIRRLDNGQIPGAMTARGGYNCRHEWQAVAFLENEQLLIRYPELSEYERAA